MLPLHHGGTAIKPKVFRQVSIMPYAAITRYRVSDAFAGDGRFLRIQFNALTSQPCVPLSKSSLVMR